MLVFFCLDSRYAFSSPRTFPDVQVEVITNSGQVSSWKWDTLDSGISSRKKNSGLALTARPRARDPHVFHISFPGQYKSSVTHKNVAHSH